MQMDSLCEWGAVSQTHCVVIPCIPGAAIAPHVQI